MAQQHVIREMRRYRTGTADRQVVGVGPKDLTTSSRPVALFLHGAFSAASGLGRWVERLDDRCDVVLGCLPGHQLAERYDTPAVEPVAGSFLTFLRLLAPGRPATVVGESLGGLIALAMGASGQVRRVVAAEPPLRTDTLWQLDEIAAEVERRGHGEIVAAARAMLAPRDHRPLLKGLVVPADVIAGEDWSAERAAVVVDTLPSLLDPDSREAVAKTPLARLHVVPGGHALLRAPSLEVVTIIEQALGGQ